MASMQRHGVRDGEAIEQIIWEVDSALEEGLW